MVLEIPEENAIPWKPLKLATKYKVGEDIVFAGYPALDFPKIRFGKLAIHRNHGIMVYPSYRGDSGGIVLNMKGELISIIYGGIRLRSMTQLQETFVGYGIPLEVIKDFL